jgi:molybdopterin synthase sulfur carrier subunit
VIRILFFGELRDAAGTSESVLPLCANSKVLRDKVLETWPTLQGKTFSIAVNRKIQSEDVPLKEGDEIALMPPFSGG